MGWLNMWLSLMGYAVVRVDEHRAMRAKADRLDDLNRAAQRLVSGGVQVRWVDKWDVN